MTSHASLLSRFSAPTSSDSPRSSPFRAVAELWRQLATSFRVGIGPNCTTCADPGRVADKTWDRRGRCREAARWPVASDARSLHDTTARSARDYSGWSNSDFASAQPVGRARMSRCPYETPAQRARSHTVMRMLVELGLLDVKVIAHRHRTTKSPRQVKPGRLRSDPGAERPEIKSVVSSAWSPTASGGSRSCLIGP